MTEPELDYGLVEAIDEYWHGHSLPAVLITDRASIRAICNDLGTDPAPVVNSGEGYTGVNLLGAQIWIDERFDQPVLIGGKDDSRETESS